MGGKVRWEVKLGGRQSWVGDKVRWEVKLRGRQSWVGGKVGWEAPETRSNNYITRIHFTSSPSAL